MNRKPPSHVIKELCREVGFACPVCGSPFLTWHHFDPPWSVKKHHNPAGMIALCPEHAAHADGGHWTIEQQRRLKRPINVDQRVEATWPWQPEKAVFMLGNSYYVGERALLSINGRRIFGATRYLPPGFDYSAVMFSICLHDKNDRPVLTLNDNVLSFCAEHLVEVHCPPQARSFEVKGKSGEYLKLQHRRLSLREFVSQVPPTTFNQYDTPSTVERILQASALDSEGKLSVIEISGALYSRDIDMKLERGRSTMLMKIYNNELVNIPGRFYFPHLSLGGICIKHGEREILSFG